MAVGTAVAVLAIIGLVVGLVVFVVVILLLNGVLTPLRKVLADVQYAKTAPMLERGVPGTDQLGTTRRLAESVPDLALRYLQKLSIPANTAPAPAEAPAATTAAPPQAPSPQAPPPQAPPPQAPPPQATEPAWKAYRR